MKKEFNDEILKGEIIIDRPLTVFTGRNGTGKSYAAKRIAGYYIPFCPNSTDEFDNYTVCPSKKPNGEYAEISKNILNELLNCQFNTFDDSYRFEWITPIDKEARNVNPAGYVSAMIPFLIKLRYSIGRGDTIILDLPETYQHPENQILIARFIAKLANAGLKVVLVTHSDKIKQQLNNLVLLGEIKESEAKTEFMKEFELTADMGLLHTDVRNYDFAGGEVKEIAVDGDGFNFVDIVNVAENLYNERMRLFGIWSENKEIRPRTRLENN